MAIGAGKYDQFAQATAELLRTDVFFMVAINGIHGDGACCKFAIPKNDPGRGKEWAELLAKQLRKIADEMEKDAKNLNFG